MLTEVYILKRQVKSSSTQTFLGLVLIPNCHHSVCRDTEQWGKDKSQGGTEQWGPETACVGKRRKSSPVGSGTTAGVRQGRHEVKRALSHEEAGDVLVSGVETQRTVRMQPVGKKSSEVSIAQKI